MNARARRAVVRTVYLGGAALMTAFLALYAMAGGALALGPWQIPWAWLVPPAGVLSFVLAWRMSDPRLGEQRRIAHELGYGAESFLSRRR